MKPKIKTFFAEIGDAFGILGFIYGS